MRMIVDTNIIISALIKDSITRQIILHNKADFFEFLTINFSNKEIQKYKQYIIEKTKISETEFELIFSLIKQKLTLIDDSATKIKMDEAIRIMDKIDPDDTVFIAAALVTNADIWSNDEHFEKQKKIKVWKTKELLELMIQNNNNNNNNSIYS